MQWGHFSFNWDGARMRSSWWSGVAVTDPLTNANYTPALPITPPPAPVMTASGYPLLVQGATGPEVVLAQKAIGVTADGKFGPITATALGAWQTKNKLTATKKLDNATWSKMVALKLVPSRVAHPLQQYVNVVLKRGSTGTAVKALQKALGGLTVDGSFGPATETKVKAYQKAKGLTVNGIADSKVWNALISGSTTIAPAPAPAPAPTTNELAKYAGLTLKLWSKGEAVSAMQKAIGKLTVDGSFGRLTEARVKEYQTEKKLPVTGVVDAGVWKALMGTTTTTAPAPSGSSVTSLATAYTPYKGTVLKVGSSGAAVKVLQRGLGGLVVDGSFGSLTLTSVKRFQTAKGLAVTGVVDAKTWAALELTTHPLLPYWGTVVKRGSTGAAVVALQKALRITADGKFGPITEAAVKSAQASAKLSQTGVVGTLTWKAVEARMPR